MDFENPIARELYNQPLEDVMCHQLRCLICDMQSVVAVAAEYDMDANTIAEKITHLLKELQ